MDHPEPNKSQIRGKDLAGAIKVMPMGLDAAIKKRVSGEFKSEQRGGAVSFSSAETTSTSMKSSMKTSMESRTMQSFQEEVPEPKIGTPFQQAGFKSAPSQDQQTTSFIQNSSMKQQQSNSSSFGQSSCQQMSSSMSTSQKSMMTSSSSSTKSVSMQSSSITQKDFGEAGSQMSFQQEPEEALEVHQEIGQDNLKTQLVSCISDLEKDRDFVDFNKENAPLSLSSPPPTFSPGPGTTQKQEATPPHKQDMFSPPPLEPMEPPKPQAEPMKPLATQPQPMAQPIAQPIRNGVQNGFSDFLGSSSQTVEMCQASSYQQSTQQVMNGSFEETGSVQGSSSSSSLLQKIMTPANPEYDTGSLKRRDPRKMFTDSSFYSAKHHPTVADQVEMAHKLSSAMFNDKNKSTKGQQMFLSRVQNAGDEEAEQDMDPNKMPNLKHVMNPEGRMLEWGDVTQEELPNVDLMATHAAPNLNTPDPIAESLNAEAGKGGELFAKRRKRAENWVVDEASIGQAKPSAFADKFMSEQTERQAQFAQEAHAARQQKAAEVSQQQVIQHTESQQQQNFAKQQFTQQQQLKQEQSLELRRQQQAQEQIRMQQEIEFPDNFKRTSLRATCTTPILDLGCHNVQGINVWANTAPRGWGGSTPGPQGLPKAPVKQQGPPELAVCPATPIIEQEQQEMIRLQQEELARQEQEMIAIEQMEIQREKEEQQRVQLEYEQLQQQKEMEKQQEMLKQQQEMERQQQELQRQQEQERLQEQQRLEEQQRQQMLQRQEEEQKLKEQQRLQEQEQQRMQEQQRLEQQRQEQIELERQQEIQRLEEQQKMQMQMQMQQQEQMKQQQQQHQLARQQQEEEQRMQQTMQQQQQQQQQQATSQFSLTSSSSTTTTGGSSQQQSQECFSQETTSSFSQSSTSLKTNEVYEATSTERAMRGYQVKGEESSSGRLSARARDSGLFGGIGGDDNTLVDNEFDYKKHSVKDLAQHFAAVKPKAQIPIGILPEQKMYNGEQGPALNYLGGKKDFAEQKQVFVKKEVSAEDIEASKQAYEMKKKQQMEQKAQESSSSSVTMREKKTVETRVEQTENRQSTISSALLMDPAAAHAQAGIIDPSAILRGSDGNNRASIGAGRSSEPGETELVASKWDNHNAIARGWGGMKANYHPVTFREIYNVESQAKEQTTQNL